MASNFLLNDSMLERTMTEGFQEFKGFQAEVQEKVVKVTEFYKRVKDHVVDDSQAGSGAILME